MRQNSFERLEEGIETAEKSADNDEDNEYDYDYEDEHVPLSRTNSWRDNDRA